MTGNLNLLHGLTIDKAYFEFFGKSMIIKTTDGKTVTITGYCFKCDDTDYELKVQLEDSDSTVLLDIDV